MADCNLTTDDLNKTKQQLIRVLHERLAKTLNVDTFASLPEAEQGFISRSTEAIFSGFTDGQHYLRDYFLTEPFHDDHIRRKHNLLETYVLNESRKTGSDLPKVFGVTPGRLSIINDNLSQLIHQLGKIFDQAKRGEQLDPEKATEVTQIDENTSAKGWKKYVFNHVQRKKTPVEVGA